MPAFIYFLSILCFRYLLDLNYVVTYERFSYAGLFKLNYSEFNYIFSWFLLITFVPFFLIARKKKSVSSKIIQILILISLVPTTSLIGFRSDYETKYILLISAYWFMFLFLWTVFPTITVSNRVNSSRPFNLAVVILSSVVVYVWVVFSNFHFQLDLFDTVYETREQARGYQINSLLAYLLLFSDNILPFAVVYYLFKKKYILGLVIAVIVYLNFSITAQKQVIFLLFLGIFGFYFYDRLTKPNIIVFGFISLLIVCLVEPIFFGTQILNSFLPYRVIFIPAELHYAYYEFFQTNPVDYFAQSALSFMFDSDYDTAIAFLIGQATIGDINARGNNGLFSDAYQNLGDLGSFLLPLLTVLYLKVLDGVTKKHNQKLFFVIFLYISFVLLGIPLSTALLSSGLVALILILILLPGEHSSRSTKPKNNQKFKVIL